MGRPLNKSISTSYLPKLTLGPNVYTYLSQYTSYSGACNRASNGSRAAREAYLATNGYEIQRAYQFSCTNTKLTMSESTQQPLPTGTYATIQDTFYVTNILNVVPRTLLSTDPWVVSTRTAALTDLNKRVRDQTTGLGELFAEGRKTADMLTKSARRVIRGFLAVKQMAKAKSPSAFKSGLRNLGDQLGISTAMYAQPKMVRERYSRLKRGLDKRASIKDTTMNASSLWLEYRYGWLPLYSTAYGAMVAYDKIARRKHVRHVFGRSTNVPTPSSGYWEGEHGLYCTRNKFGNSNFPAWMSWKIFWTQRETLRIQVGYYLELKNSNLATNSVLGLSDPLTLAWELMPLSFVVDWFVNAGDVLQQVSNFNGWEFKAGYQTYTQTATKDITVIPWNVPNNASQKVTCKPGGGSVENYLFRRELLTGVQFFGLQLSNGLNLTRLFDAIALGRQRVR